MKVELEFNGGGQATAYIEKNEAVKDDQPKTGIHVLGSDFTLTKWNKEKGLLHYKQVENSMQRKVG
jgi:hypothetical protein